MKRVELDDHVALLGARPNSSSVRLAKRARKPVLQRLTNTESYVRRLWVLVQLLTTLYYTVTVPLFAAFYAHLDVLRFEFFVFGYLCDLFVLADIVLQFNSRQGQIWTGGTVYLQGFFVIDALSIVPVDLFFFTPLWLHALLRLNRLLRLVHVNQWTFMWERFSLAGPVLVRLSKLSLAVLLISHWICCGYVGISQLEGYANSWGVGVEFANASLPAVYFQGFSYSWRIMSRVGGSFVGPSTVLEKGFILLLSFVMLFLGAVVIGEIASNITAANLRNANFTKKLRSLHGFFRSKHVPLPLQKRIIRAMNARWTSTAEDETDVRTVLQDLSRDLDRDVAVFMWKPVLESVAIFRGLDLASVAPLLARRLFADGEFIVREGDAGRSMFFIGAGECEVFVTRQRRPFEASAAAPRASLNTDDHAADMEQDDQPVAVQTLTNGQFFGEAALLVSRTRRTASVRAVGLCEVFELTYEALIPVLRRSPAVYAAVDLEAHLRFGQTTLARVLPHDLVKQLRVAKFSQRERVDCRGSLVFLVAGDVRVLDASSGSLLCLVASDDENCFFGSLCATSFDSDYVVEVASSSAFVLSLPPHVSVRGDVPAPRDAAAFRQLGLQRWHDKRHRLLQVLGGGHEVLDEACAAALESDAVLAPLADCALAGLGHLSARQLMLVSTLAAHVQSNAVRAFAEL